jgi:aspartate-semialdehyde dehydrogenase
VTDGEGDAPGKTLPVSDVAAFDFSRVDLVFFCGRAALSERYAEAAAAHAWVIDGSAAFRALRRAAGGRGRQRGRAAGIVRRAAG